MKNLQIHRSHSIERSAHLHLENPTLKASRRRKSLVDALKDRGPTSMTTIGTNETPVEDLSAQVLNDLLNELQNGAIRKPDHLNHLHFLLLLLYDAFGYPRDRYPLWRWYYRIKKKHLISKHFTIENDVSRQTILSVLELLVEAETNLNQLFDESVQFDEQYLNSTLHGLFQSYSTLHTYLYLEQINQPVMNKHSKLFDAFRSAILNRFDKTHCDLIHFVITHKNTDLLTKIFGQETMHWLDLSMNLATERGWLPLHYACYVGDKKTVKIICDKSFSLSTSSILIPKSKQNQFETNPNEFILRAYGMDQRTSSKQLVNNRLLLPKENRRSTIDVREPSSYSTRGMTTNDNDIPDADELELSSLPLIQREEFIDKILHMSDEKNLFVPSPLILAAMATCNEKNDYEEIVKILLESHLVEFDGFNHESILNDVFDWIKRQDFATFQYVRIYRDTEIEGPSTFLFYQFDGFIVNQDVKPLSGALSGSSASLNTSKNDGSERSDDDQTNGTPISLRCFLTILVLRDTFSKYPRWDFHLLREIIEEHFPELENALGCRPTILYPDGDILSSRKRSDVTWEVVVKYRLSSENGQSIFMQVDYNFFDTFGDPLADAFTNIYQTPFYMSCMTDSTMMMEQIFESFFKRRHLHCWGTVAPKHLEHCFDGVLQMKNNCTTFLSLCSILSRYYQVEGDPFIEENSSMIQRMFVHGFACCVRRNAKIELDYLIKNHALIYYDSCRNKPSDIRHNILTYCVVRNLSTIFDQLMSNMKTMMYKTYQNSTNPDWQPHIAWREIIHVIIDPVLQQNSSNEQNELTQLVSYGDTSTNYFVTGTMPILHTTNDEYLRCIGIRQNLILKAKRKLPRALSDTNKQRPRVRRMTSLDQQQMKNSPRYSIDHGDEHPTRTRQGSLTKKSRNIWKNVHRLRWGSKYESHHLREEPSNPNEVSDVIDAISLPNVDDDDENFSEEKIAISSSTPKLLRRCETIDNVRLRKHRTALQHLQDMFWPRRDPPVIDEYEEIPMTSETKTKSHRLRDD